MPPAAGVRAGALLLQAPGIPGCSCCCASQIQREVWAMGCLGVPLSLYASAAIIAGRLTYTVEEYACEDA